MRADSSDNRNRQNKMLRLVFVALITVQTTFGAKILAFVPTGVKSHHLVFQPTLRALADRGHEVTYFTNIPIENPHPKTFRQILIENKLYTSFEKALPGATLSSFGDLSVARINAVFCDIGLQVTEYAFEHPEGRKLIESTEKFDLIIHEALFLNEAVVGLQHRFQAPGVMMIPLADNAWINHMSGLDDNPSYMIDFKTDLTDRLTFFERLINVYTLAATLFISHYKLGRMQEMMDRRLNYTGWETRPSIKELLGDIALVLMNSHHSVGYNYPRAPHVKDIGGMNIRPLKPLPKELAQMLDDSHEGVIYFSLGSNLDLSHNSSAKVRQAFANVFAKLKHRVLWRLSDKKSCVISKNVHVSAWFPQQEILAHKNIKLFISQGGMLSTTEAVNSGVPVIGIPFFGDQRKVVNQFQQAGFGIRLDKYNLTETSIMWAITEILNNEKYKKTALKHQALFRDRPMSPVDESVYWIEYILRHGNILKPVSTKMPFYKLYLIDVFAFLGLMLISSLVILKKCISFALTQCGISGQKQQLRKKNQ